jgi:hypothetical protein
LLRQQELLVGQLHEQWGAERPCAPGQRHRLPELRRIVGDRGIADLAEGRGRDRPGNGESPGIDAAIADRRRRERRTVEQGEHDRRGAIAEARYSDATRVDESLIDQRGNAPVERGLDIAPVDPVRGAMAQQIFHRPDAGRVRTHVLRSLGTENREAACGKQLDRVFVTRRAAQEAARLVRRDDQRQARVWRRARRQDELAEGLAAVLRRPV